MCGNYEKEIAKMFLKAFDDSEEKISCRCDSITANINKAKVNSLEIITRMLDDKPYYELKYRQVGKKDYSIGYSSYDLKVVLSYINTYFEIVENNDKHTNADKIRNMSDGELAMFIGNLAECTSCDLQCSESTTTIDECCRKHLEWLQSEVE